MIDFICLFILISLMFLLLFKCFKLEDDINCLEEYIDRLEREKLILTIKLGHYDPNSLDEIFEEV